MCGGVGVPSTSGSSCGQRQGGRRRGRHLARRCTIFYGLNGSVWSTARDFLSSHCEGKVAVLFGQEHRLEANWMAEAAAAAYNRGWQVAYSEATTGTGGGISAGTFIVVPSYIGIAHLQGQTTFDLSPVGCPGRLCAGWAPLLMKGGSC